MSYAGTERKRSGGTRSANRNTATLDPREKMQRNRIIRARGTAQTAKDFDLKDFLTVQLLNPKWENKATVWFPSGKESFKSGKPFIFRMLPALSISEGEEDFADFVPGRDPHTGELSMEMIRAVGIIDKFGSHDHQICFMPQLPYQPDGGYPDYTGPHDNPLTLLRNGLRAAARANSLPSKWAPLLWSEKTTKEELERVGASSQYAKRMLPDAAARYVSYVWVYAGFDRKQGREGAYITAPDCPIGSLPEHGLQIAVLSEQIFGNLARLYQTKETKKGRATNEFQYPDPASEQEGCLNYAWNRLCPSPIDGSPPGKAEGFGYTATASVDYYEKANRPEEFDLALPPEFSNWYYQNWQWWEDILQPVTGVEQVPLIAEYFPELGPVCMQIWDGHDELIAAAEKAPFSKKEVDFFDLLVAMNTPRSKTSSAVLSRGSRVADSDFDEEDYEPDGPVTRSSASRKSRRLDDEEEEAPPKRRRTLVDEDEEEEPERPARRKPSPADAEAEERPARRRQPQVEVEDDEEEDYQVADRNPMQRIDVRAAAKAKVQRQRKPAPSAEPDENEYDDSDYEDSDE